MASGQDNNKNDIGNDGEESNEMNEERESLLGILHSKHYNNILKQVYASASSTYDPLSQFHPNDIKQSSSASPTPSFIMNNNNNNNERIKVSMKPKIERLQINRIDEEEEEEKEKEKEIHETRPKETPFLKPIYSLRIPSGLPTANKLLYPINDEIDNNNNNNFDDQSLSQQEIMTVHTDTNTPEIIQQIHDNSSSTKDLNDDRNYDRNQDRFRSDSSLMNDEENFISMAILDAYKYRRNKPKIPVSKHLIETIKYGSMPTQRIGINYSPSTYHLNNHLLEFNDKSGRHPLSKLKKSDLANTEKNYVLNYHNNHKNNVKANKSMNNRILLSHYNDENKKYKLNYNENELYSISNKPNIKISLQLFDENELETLNLNNLFNENGKANQELIGFATYYNKNNDSFIWHKCNILEYDRLNNKFLIKFIVKEHNNYIKSTEEEIAEENKGIFVVNESNESQEFIDKIVRKYVSRLYLRFECEDESVFNDRYNLSKRRKDGFLAIRRYWDFIASQNDNLISSIDCNIFHNILYRLDCNKYISSIIIENEGSVIDLLINIRNDYELAMKASLLEYARINGTEKQRLNDILLPIFIGDMDNINNFGTINIKKREFIFNDISLYLSSWLFFKYSPLTKTLLEISSNFDQISNKNCLIKISNYGEAIGINKFKERQDDHLVAMQDTLIVDWREKAISLVRDIDLGSEFDFFVKSRKIFETIPLYKFLKRTQFLMRQQLVQFIIDSIDHWVEFLDKASKNIHSSPSGLNTKYTLNWPIQIKSQCFFLYSLTTNKSNKKICFEPELDTLSIICQSILNIPDKFESINNIDTVLVPFVGIPTQPMVKKNTCSHLFEYIRKNKEKISISINLINKYVLEIKDLYKKYEYMLEMDGKEYAQQWFAESIINKNDDKENKENNNNNKEKEEETEESEDSLINDIIPEPIICHTMEETENEIKKYWNAIHEIHVVTPQQVQFSLIQIDCNSIQEILICSAQKIVDQLLDGTRREIDRINQYILDLTAHQLRIIEKKCNDIEELSALQQFIKQVTNQTLPSLREKINESTKRHNLLIKFHTNLDIDQFEKLWKAASCPNKLILSMEKQEEILIDEEEKFKCDLQREQDEFMLELRNYAENVEEFSNYGPCNDQEMDKRARFVEQLSDKLDAAKEKAKAFNRKEELFKLPLTEYADLEMTFISFEPYSKLWRTTSLFVANHNVWTSGAFNELDSKQIESDIRHWYSILHKLEKKLKSDKNNISPSSSVCCTFKERINDFRKHLPIISNLRNPGLRARHWNKLSNVLKQQRIDPDKFLTYNILLQFNITDHIDEIEEICMIAEKEFSLEQALDSMANEWSIIEFQLKQHRGTYILRGLDEIMEKLDDHIVKTQTMKGSPYIEAFKIRIEKWEKLLQLVSSCLDEWIQVQKTWMYLEPIFGSPDIMRQMPKEGKQFGVVDNVWNNTMKECLDNSIVLEFTGRENLLKAFIECNKILDKIQKGLNDYLETKRLAFPRFYFLSNDELLEILSQTKNVRAVQPHLSKCFDGLVSVQFGDNDIIEAMISGEGEIVSFLKPVDPNFGSSKGNVEVWLNDVQQSMIECLKDIMLSAYKSYIIQARKEWILSWPGQVVLAISQCYWTLQVESAIKTKGNRGLKEYVKKLNMQLKDIVQLVRGQLTKLQRKTIGPLVVIDVHARDVIQDMIQQNVSSIDDFEWIAQLRYYMDQSDGNNTLIVKMINANLKYGYEYLGNSGRLVITPLTDRCYRTLMGALKLYYGGAPEGPAGTGKTETVKDLAKALAKQCIVFNCSDSLDYLAMAKFFKGLASSGAWSCFDEFNRINLEVLSVIAQQILTIQLAIREGKERFWFEGVELPLIHSCSVFITMNPGYAGRSDLPDNLKALFRTVAMMVPDYALIAEIMLYSYGYSDARVLSKKLVTSLRLSSEQLSSQYHYDFGMRNVKSILVAAGNLKRQFVNEREDLLVLRAINDCNLSKFTSQDIPLFRGITKDLFPGVILPESDYKLLTNAIINNCTKYNLQPKETFIQRCLQIYETAAVRHGFMVVGNTYAGKSSAIKVITSAICDLAISKELENAVNIIRYTINPKAQSMNRLYGAFDEATHEWSNGVLAKTIRECAANQSIDKKWIVFDGPVDTLWIENMNTVLDDNKKLCLASGEIIKLSSTMSIVFEVDDLSVASPATISRVGMVFLEPKQLGWKPITISWYNTLSKSMQQLKEKFDILFHSIFEPAVIFILENTVSIIHLTAEGHITNLLRLMNTTLDRFKNEEKITTVIWNHLEAFFIYSLIWSVGANTNTEGRAKFSIFLIELLSNLTPKLAIPIPVDPKKNANVSVYDFVFSSEKKRWLQWMDISGKFEIAPTAKYENITVPTVDTVRSSYLLESLLFHHYRTLFIGPTGTGKSKIIYEKLLDELPNSKWDPICITFSAQTTELQAQLTVQDKLVKRTKTMRGPILGKQAVLFIDDLNMPEKEEFGAQPPLELFRQFCDYSGWYDENIFLKLVDVQMIAAMGTPGGGANVPTTRLTRHFNIIGFVPYDDNSLQRIFSTIVNWWCRSCNLSSTISKLIPKMINATVDIYSTLKQELKPTPEKSHYTFNLRDMSKVFGGILNASPKYLKSSNDLIRVWSHECQRVFSDRLISINDIKWFNNILNKKSEKHFKIDFIKDILDGNENKTLFYTHFHTEADPAEYTNCNDFNKLKSKIEEILDDYNQISGSPMDLVLFQDAISHICRISRIMNQPAGSALLVGVGGSGRQSLTKLATSIAEYELYQVQVSSVYGILDWKEDLKKLFFMAGLNGKQVVFLFNDTQIKFESMLEDVNNILNNGEVPGLFGAEDMPQIIDEVSQIAKKEGKSTDLQSVLSLFVERCKNNIHIFLCLSPIGDEFRTRLRRFPSLVNCCTIDWFHRWPEQALKSVANRYLSDVNMQQDIKEKVVNACVTMQESVIETASEFLFANRINTYVTPTSYLDLLQTFKNLFEKSRLKISEAKKRYDIGLDKLKTTQEQVKEMQQQLEELQPQLEESVTATNKLMKEIEIKTKDADGKKAIVAVEEEQCNKQAASAKEQADECQKELDVALPAYEQAMAALKVIKKSDLAQVKKYSKPPPGVVLTMEAVCIMMNVKPKKIGEVGKKVDDYWDQAKKYVLGDTKLLEKLQNYDKDNIAVEIMQKVGPYIANPEFEPEKIASASGACKGLCLWVRALFTYDRVAKVVKPKQEALKKAQTEVAEAMANLATKKAELKKITDLLDNLNEQFNQAVAKKDDLQNQVEQCAKRLERAEKLINGLGGEYKSWNIKSLNLAKDFENVVGDIVIASGIIAYLGIYTSTFRQKTIEKWVKYLKNDLEISCADPFSLVNTLGDPIQIREWIISKLPKDEFSITNAIIFDKSIKFPLFVDPQGQGNRWIKNMEKDNELTIIKLSDHEFGRSLENCIQFGKPLLIENVGETLDPILEPILLKQLIVSGSRKLIKLGEQTIDFDENFRLYITTKLGTPHYTPTVSTKVVLLNFAITLDGLDDQMLAIVVGFDESEMEKKREEIVIEQSEMNKKLVSLEDTILRLLSEAKGQILDDSVLIDTLQKSKNASKTIEKRMSEAKIVEQQINNVRQEYSSLSRASANLFFVVSDMAMIDPMYQYSLDWFLNLFMRSINNSQENENKKIRTKNIDNEFKKSLYRNVCRSLFAKDKLLFSFMLCSRILSGKNKLNFKEFRFILTGAGLIKNDESKPNPFNEWMDDKMWGEIRALSALSPSFKNLDIECIKNSKLRLEFKSFYDSSKPYEFNKYLPFSWNSRLNNLQKLCILRCFRMDSMIPAIQEFVSLCIGEFFVRPPPFDLDGPFKDSNSMTPIIFILSSGSDPMNELLSLSKKYDMNGKDRMFSISLGQGQGPVANAAIEEAIDKGTWVILQNCHLAPSWMPSLEKIIENFNEQHINPSFRLWLTAMPSSDFPMSILQNGVKVTNEPPKGIQANLRQTYQSLDIEWFNSINSSILSIQFKKTMFALSFFHAIVQERRKFGPLGWNIPYQFNESDLRISYAQLQMFLNEISYSDDNKDDKDDKIPWKQLKYMTGELNYGGRVTDDKDRRTLMTILDSYYTPKLIKEKQYKFSTSSIYYIPDFDNNNNGGSITNYLQYISELPLIDDPEIFGLNNNANISCAIFEANQLLSNALMLQPRDNAISGDMSKDEVIMKIIKEIESQLPDLYDIQSISEKYPVSYSESMNTVLVQELLRFNRLLNVVSKSLSNLQKAIRGEVIMSSELEKLGDSIFNLQVPSLWAAVSYPSLKPLGSWIKDLLDRLSFFKSWVNNGQPSVYWLSGFFFTQSFLTGALQNFARKYQIPIDELIFTFKIMNKFENNLNNQSDSYLDKLNKYISKIKPPKDGCYIYGLYLDGASWDWHKNILSESKPKQLFSSMPIIWFKPIRISDINNNNNIINYSCPVYKTSQRAGSLSTTGHSTNYVLTCQLPTDKTQKHWILRGVAMLTQLDS